MAMKMIKSELISQLHNDDGVVVLQIYDATR